MLYIVQNARSANTSGQVEKGLARQITVLSVGVRE